MWAESGMAGSEAIMGKADVFLTVAPWHNTTVDNTLGTGPRGIVGQSDVK